MFMDLSKKNHEKKAHTIFLVKKKNTSILDGCV